MFQCHMETSWVLSATKNIVCMKLSHEFCCSVGCIGCGYFSWRDQERCCTLVFMLMNVSIKIQIKKYWYSAFKCISSMQAKTETCKFHEIGKCLPLRRLMRIFLFCFDLCLLPPVSSSCFLQLMSISVECTTFLLGFFSSCDPSCAALQKHCLIVEPHPVLLYPCSCGGFLSSAAVAAG